jgi:methylphosphotriester-DNA--protein-cysteine methyltransferase
MVKKLFAGLLLGVCLMSFSGIGVSQESKVYVGSKNSTKYHYTWCRWAQKINPDNKVVFNSVKETQAAGYIPCKVCKPPVKD